MKLHSNGVKKLISIIYLGFILTGSLFAQKAQDYRQRDASKSSPTNRRDQAALPDSAEPIRRQMPFSKIAIRRKFYEGKLSKEQKKLLIPAEEIVLKYKQFLKTPETGIVKILSDPKCEENILDVNNLKCVNALPIYGNGAHYSFSKKTHAGFNTAEISLTDNFFKVGFLANFSSLIIDLGNIDINSVGENTEEAKILQSVVPVKSFSKFPVQKRVLDRGFFFNGKQYKTSAPAEINHTYILRSVRYYTVYYFMSEPYYDDITIAFRFVERDSAGNVTLLWKKVAQKKNVHLAR